MECEMCGGNASAVAMVEGVRMNVCVKCAGHGVVVKRIEEKRREVRRLPPQKASEELIEAVHPDAAKFLREHRERLGVTQEEFARRLNIRLSAYQHYESGKTAPDISLARRLEHEVKRPLVVRIAVRGSATPQVAGGPVTLGDLMKKK